MIGYLKTAGTWVVLTALGVGLTFVDGVESGSLASLYGTVAGVGTILLTFNRGWLDR